MRNLYWRSPGKTRSLAEKPFKSENELEKYIFDNQELLGGDVSVIHRQIRTGSRQGIPDMLGVDKDSRVCLIELKNAEANEDIVSQAVNYAIWAEANPDSIKAIWLESQQKPDGVALDWDNLDVRIILIAPSFKSTVARMAGKLGYKVDLVQIARYSAKQEEFLVVDVIEAKPPEKGKTTKPLGEWSWEFYKNDHGREAALQFRKAVDAVAALVRKQGWDLPYNLNKHYTGFKLGNRAVVFSVAWGGTRAWNMRFKLPEAVAKKFKGRHWEFQRYDNVFHEAVFRPLRPNSPGVAELRPIFIEAYRYVSGRK